MVKRKIVIALTIIQNISYPQGFSNSSIEVKFMPQTPVKNCAGRNMAETTVKMYKVLFICRSWYLSASESIAWH